jgi:hypothetical protein
MKQTVFYMIYVEGGNSPTYKHDSYESASKEAYRLAGTTGKEVFILSAVASCKKEIINIGARKPEDDDLPF